MTKSVDVLCAGFACYDLIFSVDKHPAADEKVFAERLLDCGGGPAANAAFAIARLGVDGAFAGYLGDDLYGRKHLEELEQAGVQTDLIVTGDAPTPLSAILVKPDGLRTVINYKGATVPIAAGTLDLDIFRPKVLLFDGHQPYISEELIAQARRQGIRTVLDAGSLHTGTKRLAGLVDFVVASEKFARQVSGQEDVAIAAEQLHRPGLGVVVTQGAYGLVWQTDTEAGHMAAFKVEAVDTTGAGDAFHGAFAAGLAVGLSWQMLLQYASATAALCCRKFGARLGMPTHEEVNGFLQQHL